MRSCGRSVHSVPVCEFCCLYSTSTSEWLVTCQVLHCTTCSFCVRVATQLQGCRQVLTYKTGGVRLETPTRRGMRVKQHKYRRSAVKERWGVEESRVRKRHCARKEFAIRRENVEQAARPATAMLYWANRARLLNLDSLRKGRAPLLLGRTAHPRRDHAWLPRPPACAPPWPLAAAPPPTAAPLHSGTPPR